MISLVIHLNGLKLVSLPPSIFLTFSPEEVAMKGLLKTAALNLN